jgi:hypothetical protein
VRGMSYCRWSSDNWKCDVYVYEAADGYTIHVAGNRIIGDVPEIAWDQGVDRLGETARAAQAYLNSCSREPIGLPYDGQTFVLPDPTECAAKLRDLRDLGYHVPDYAIAELEAEAAEIVAGETP